MIKRKFLVILLSSLFVSAPTVHAQSDYEEPPLEKVQRPYKFNDNLFYGYSVGGSYSLSSFVSERNFISMLRPNGDLFIGKAFSKAFLAKASVGYHAQISSIPDKVLDKMYEYSGDKKLYERGPNYSIHMINTSVDGMICLNRIFGNTNQDARVKVYAIGGVGLNSIFAYSKTSSYWTDYINIDRSIKFAPEVHAGLQTSIRSDERKYYDIQCTWHQTSNDYTGFKSQGVMRHYLELKFGITKRMLNRYASYRFENCKGNEKYYFDHMEKKKLKELEKYDNGNHFGSVGQKNSMEDENILSFPHLYPYLTPYQSAKLEKMVAKLKENPYLQAVIDVYPYVTSNDEMTFSQSIDRCKEEINNVISKYWGTESVVPVRFIEHTTENSSIYPDGIWFHNAFIHYENK